MAQDATTKGDITWQAVGVGVITAVVAFSVGVFARALGVAQAGGTGREFSLKDERGEPSQRRSQDP